MAEFNETGEVVIQGEGRLRRRLDLGETILGKATLKGPIVTERVMATLQSRLSLLPVGEGALDLWEGATPTWAQRSSSALVCLEGGRQREEETGIGMYQCELWFSICADG